MPPAVNGYRTNMQISVCRSCNATICPHLPASVRIGLAYTLVYAHALYGAEALAAPRNDLGKMDAICKAAIPLVFGLHQSDCHAEILFVDCCLLPLSELISAAKQCWKVTLSKMSAARFLVAVGSITIPTRRQTVSALWQVFLQKQIEVREGKDKVLVTWIREVITHDLGRCAPFIDGVAPVMLLS